MSLSRKHRADPRTLNSILQDNNIQRRTFPTPELSPTQVSQIVERYQKGESKAALARAFGVNHTTILSRLIQSGIKLRTFQECAKLWTKLDKTQADEMVSLYQKGWSTAELATKYNLSRATIANYAEKQGVPRRSIKEGRRKHSLDESVFDDINEESAYWIGMLMADGNVSKPMPNRSHVIKLTLIDTDWEHIAKFQKFLKTSKPLHYSRHTANLAVSSDRLAESLARYGVTPRKSLTAQAIQLQYNKDFWRGVIDGDGCIAKPPLRRFGLVGSDILVAQFASFAESQTGKNPIVRKRGNISATECYGERAEQMLTILYEGCSIALERKLNLANKVIMLGKLTPVSLGAALKRQRQEEGLTLDALALKFNTSVGTIWRLERGRTMPYRKVLDKIIAWLGLTSNDLSNKPPSIPR